MKKPVPMELSAPQQTGLVVSYHGQRVMVEATDGHVFQCQLRRNQTLPVVGDQVEFTLSHEQSGIITRILPRRSILTRGQDRKGQAKVLAANVDVLLIVMAPPPNMSEYLLDRYVIAAELLRLRPIILLNKKDLLSDEEEHAIMQRFAPYRAIPYDVIFTSAKLHDGLAVLQEKLSGLNAVLVGPSGVGKSSLIAALTQENTIVIGDVTTKGTGKHTTTATRLYHLPHGGHVIDSPGVREFKLWQVSPESILSGFKEFHAFLTGCKFRDCQHVAEPGCAVQNAVACGKISQERYNHYQLLIKEAKEHDNPYSS